MKDAVTKFGPINILCANAGITDESASYNIWDMPTALWDRTYAVNVRGTFLTIKHFLQSVDAAQHALPKELPNVAIVLTGSECGVFGQAGHVEYASRKSALQYGLVKTVKNEIVRLNSKARINAVAPGWVNTPLIEGRLDNEGELWREAQATVPLRKITKPGDVACMTAFLASERASGHVTGQCLCVDGGMEGRVFWGRDEVGIEKGSEGDAALITERTSPPDGHKSRAGEEGSQKEERASEKITNPPSILQTSMSTPSSSQSQTKIKVLISVDFDAVSAWLGTGSHPSNNLADYSSGFFSAYVGVPRLLKLFKRFGIGRKVTWFVPMHLAESFPDHFEAIRGSGGVIALHGYCHEGAPQLTEDQEREVLEHCLETCTKLTGKKPVGYRAPLYQLRESTIALLESHSFLYDSSLSHHDSVPYYIPCLPHIDRPVYSPSAAAKDWMHPLPQPLPQPLPPTPKSLVEIPANWYAEDMTPLQFWPHTENSQGYDDVRVIEQMWKDKLEWVIDEMEDEEADGVRAFSLVLHPDTSWMAHVIGMIKRVLGWLKEEEGRWEVEFCTYEEAARVWKENDPVH